MRWPAWGYLLHLVLVLVVVLMVVMMVVFIVMGMSSGLRLIQVRVLVSSGHHLSVGR